MLTRSIKKIYPIENSEIEATLNFNEILNIPNIVLLGEPGAGKTYLFKAASQQEQGNFITARSFVCNADDSYTGRLVYIDALDEKRSRGEQIDSISEIVKLIKQIKPSKLRLSCRATDWLGETDLDLFKPYFEATGGYCVVVLEALTETEIDQILSSKDIENPHEFREQAYRKGVNALLDNPQTLIMLVDLVKTGKWPDTKKDLYDKATDLLLTEHSDIHQHKPLANCRVDDLKTAAGAACAVLLIADAASISLLKNKDNSYANITYSNADTVLAALTKRAFVTADQDESVTYSHRTIAEYLAAVWLVNTIRSGLPLTRVLRLIGVDNHPAPELRGLFAWLTQLLPEQANTLLAYDPYAVLVQGDVNCLPLSYRKALLKALVKLAETDPWFRGQDWTSEPLGALSVPEMADEFKALLVREPKQFHLRSVVLDAICYGEPQPELKDVLLDIFCDDNLDYSERERAFAGLMHAVPNCKELVAKATKEQLKTSDDDLRLREEVMASMFDGYFSVDDVARLIDDYANHRTERGVIGYFWSLSQSLPLAVLPELLDRICQIKSDDHETESQIAYFNYEILRRTLFEGETIETARLWSWISKLEFYSSGYFRGSDAIKGWFSQNQHHVVELFKTGVSRQTDLNNIWLFWNTFQQSVRFEFDIEQIIDTAFSLISEKAYCDEGDQFIFALALNLVLRRNTTTDIRKFHQLHDYVRSHPELDEIYSLYSKYSIDDWYWKIKSQDIKRKNKSVTIQENNRREFEKKQDLIRIGQHLGWLEWLANVYLARFSDVDCLQTPEQRLEQQLGEQNVALALEGLQAILDRPDLPTPLEIAKCYSENKYYPWWFAILAGMSENWRYRQDLATYPESALKAALVIN